MRPRQTSTDIKIIHPESSSALWRYPCEHRIGIGKMYSALIRDSLYPSLLFIKVLSYRYEHTVRQYWGNNERISRAELIEGKLHNWSERPVKIQYHWGILRGWWAKAPSLWCISQIYCFVGTIRYHGTINICGNLTLQNKSQSLLLLTA